MNIEPVTGLFAVYDPTTGYIVHTTVSTKPEESISMWMQIEGCMNRVVNMFRQQRGEPKQCFQSWEQFEAQGYKIVPVKLSVEEPV